MERARDLQSTAERYRLIAGTITDPDIARRLLDYADELGREARHGAADAAGAKQRERPPR